MKPPISICTHSFGISWNSQSPAAIPIGIGMPKRRIIGHSMFSRSNQMRHPLATVCMAPWIGMAAAGVMNCSISANNSEPPPTPVEVVNAEVKKIAPAKMPISIGITD